MAETGAVWPGKVSEMLAAEDAVDEDEVAVRRSHSETRRSVEPVARRLREASCVRQRSALSDV